jgi:hypothetical protein
MKVEDFRKLTESIPDAMQSRVGFVESNHPDEVKKGAQIALAMIEERLLEKGILTTADYLGLGTTHLSSPKNGDIIECTNKARGLTDPGGYRVENLGWSKGSGVPYGYFAARGVRHGGLYQFRVDQWRPFTPKQEQPTLER